MICEGHEPSTRRATPFTYAYRFFRCGAIPLLFGEKRVASKMSVPFDAGNSNFGDCARNAGHAVATRLVADVCDVTYTRLVATVTHLLSGRGSSKFSDHMIVSFSIIIK